MVESLTVAPLELSGTPDLVDLVGAARDAGHEVVLIDRPMPDAVSVVGIGRRFDIVSAPGGATLEDARGLLVDEERGPDPISAAAGLWRRLSQREGAEASGQAPPATGLVALGGFAFDPTREPGGPWQGFPALLFRVPALAVTRVRGRTFATGDESLLELPLSFRAPAVRHLEVQPLLPPAAWCEAVAEATRRLREGSAAKVVLAREVMARGDGVLAADAVVRALRGAYPACFTYLVSGSDGTAFTGASPELLVRRSGGMATCQPMAGSAARGRLLGPASAPVGRPGRPARAARPARAPRHRPPPPARPGRPAGGPPAPGGGAPPKGSTHIFNTDTTPRRGNAAEKNGSR